MCAPSGHGRSPPGRPVADLDRSGYLHHRTSQSPELRPTPRRRLDTVTAGLTLPWNSGVVEGHVNRIEMLKRQMFGRAVFELRCKRVLLA
uniref:Putative transposase for insertion sequence element n=1 Tax=Streptomyces auratus AGR0001 TaxID=1160718 RepID=J1RDS6_9ACTN